jgi:hypothetical protein
LHDRKRTLCPNISDDNYIKLIIEGSGMSIEDYKDWMLHDKWKMSGVFIYDNHMFKDPKYHSYAMMHTEIGQLCDETVWNSWIKANKIETLDVSLGIPYYYSLELDDIINTYIEENPNLYMLHPIVGDRVINPHAVELLNKIKKDFKEYGKK